MTSLETLLKEGTKVLEQHKIQEARLDAWLLLEHVTGMNRAFYFAHSADGMDEEKADRYRELIRKMPKQSDLALNPVVIRQHKELQEKKL